MSDWISTTCFAANSSPKAISSAFLSVNSRSASNRRWIFLLFIPQTNRSRSISGNVSPKLQCSVSLRNSATYAAIPSSSFRFRLWNLQRSTISLGLGEKCFSSVSTIFLKVVSAGFAGWSKSLASAYVLLPQTLSRISRPFATSSTSFARKYCSNRSTYWVHDSSHSLNSPIFP